MAKGLLLLSGGLDSVLATCILLDQGVDLEGVHFVSVFAGSSEPDGPAARSAQQLGIRLHFVDVSDEFLSIVKQPGHGYGKNMNPCIDCRIMCLRRAAALMPSCCAEFLVTGEVLGERPMSQRRHAMELIERETGLAGKIVRPLSARLLAPTEAERLGLIDREKLLDIRGRSRKPQMALAEQYGITEYMSPAGGCVLTDPNFAGRLRELLWRNPTFDVGDVELLKLGRHFRLPSGAKVVVGRMEAENDRLSDLARDGDILMELQTIPGPLTLLRGGRDEEEIELAASVTARYSKARTMDEVSVGYRDASGEGRGVLNVGPAGDDQIAGFRIV